MLNQYSNREVDRLAERLRCDTLEERDAECLREIIRHHPAARRRLVEQLYFAAELKEAISNRTFNESKPVSGGVIHQWMPRLGVGLAAAAAIMLLAVWKPWTGGDLSQPPEASVAVANSIDLDAGGFAVISRSSRVRWGEGTTLQIDRLEDGSPVGSGVLELIEGVTQIDFYSGVTVTLQGPARFHLESAQLSRLDYGSLWARVPTPARGFRVDCSAFKVVDFGTEFGIKAVSGGEGEVHVFNGEVRVQSVVEDNSPEVVLESGDGVRIEANGESTAIKARPSEFLASSKLGENAQARFHQWAAYQVGLNRDPGVLVAYSMPRVSGSSWERNVKNHAKWGPQLTDGSVVGCKWVNGRWPGKGALSFDSSSDRVRLNLPGLYEDLTLACWVRIDELKSAEVSLLHPETAQANHIHWTLLNVAEGVMHLNFAETAPRNGVPDRIYYHCPVNLARFTKLGEWVQLGLVYDSKAREVSHFVNGTVIGTSPITETRKLGIGIADIGNWPYHEWAAGTKWEVRNLNGTIDEFLIVKRAWTQAEMSKFWSVGKP